jgi:hypothetical protein
MRLLLWLFICGQAGLFIRSLGAEASATSNSAPVSVWDFTARVAAGSGYRENILRSSVAPESSGFFASTAEASLIRLSESGSYISLFLLGDDTRYFDAPSVPGEQFFSGTLQGMIPAGQSDQIGGEVQYLYQNQVLDVSETEADLQRLLVKGHSAYLRPYWKRTLRPGWAVQLEGTGMRQIYETSGLDDYWEGAGRVSLIHTYGRRSEVSVGFRSASWLYDSREQYDLSGQPVPNTGLTYWRPEVSGQWRHYWDQGRHWRTVTKVGYLQNHDNGSGYFDYDRVLFAQTVRWANSGWEVKVGARLGWYLYDVQEIKGEALERSYYVLDLRVERRLGRHWFLYAAAEREWNLSNDPLDQYNDWAAAGGAGVDF